MPIDQIFDVPNGVRGIYVLYNHLPNSKKYDVVYVGMTNVGEGVRRRLKGHRRKKQGLWTHCSIFEVWENIRDDEIVELEGLFRHIYRHDSKANNLNIQRGFKKIREVKNQDIDTWS